MTNTNKTRASFKILMDMASTMKAKAKELYSKSSNLDAADVLYRQALELEAKAAEIL